MLFNNPQSYSGSFFFVKNKSSVKDLECTRIGALATQYQKSTKKQTEKKFLKLQQGACSMASIVTPRKAFFPTFTVHPQSSQFYIFSETQFLWSLHAHTNICMHICTHPHEHSTGKQTKVRFL